MKTRVLITGAAGFLGYHLVFLLNGDFEVAGTFHNHLASAVPVQFFKIDLAQPVTVEDCIERFKPGYVVHCAASADVDWCEKNPDEAMAINRDGSVVIAEICARHGIRIIHISTDLVFDGEKGDYIESDLPNPINVYGKSKLAAEETVSNISSDNIIFRVALLYGPDSPHKKGYVKDTMDKIRRGERVRFFADQIRTPLYTADAAQAIESAINTNTPGGIYHIGGAEKLSRLQFGLKMQEIYGFEKELILPSIMADVPSMVARPKDVSFVISKATQSFGYLPTPLHSVLKTILA